jgi:hypothetical protein
MYSRQLSIVAILLMLAVANGCHKASTPSPADSKSGDQTSATQTSTNGAAPDNNPADPSAAPRTQGTQVAQDAASTTQGAPVAPNAVPEQLVIPAGTPITVRLQQRLSSASAVPGERFEAVVDEPVVVGDRVLIRVGALAEGHVIVARHSGRLHHPGELGLTLDRVTLDRQIITLNTSHVVARGGSHKKRNWGWIGGGTGGGAVIGALAAGGQGALIGSGIGAAAGTTTAFITGKKNVVFGNERRLRFRVNQDVPLFG